MTKMKKAEVAEYLFQTAELFMVKADQKGGNKKYGSVVAVGAFMCGIALMLYRQGYTEKTLLAAQKIAMDELFT